MLNKITIVNFKSLKHLEYECAGLNLLTGMNGAGKSSFIQMLRLLNEMSEGVKNPSEQVSLAKMGSQCSFKDFAYCYDQRMKIDVDIDFSSFGDNARRYTLKRTVRPGSRTGEISVERPEWQSVFVKCCRERDRLVHARNMSEYVDSKVKISDGQIDAAELQSDEDLAKEEARMRDEDQDCAREFASIWHGAKYVDAFRIAPTDVHSGGRYSVAFELFGDFGNEAFDPEGQDVAAYLYKSDHELLEEVNACLGWVSPGARLSVSEKDVGGTEYFVESVSYGDENAEYSFKPQNVGFGISYILPVLVTLLSAKPGSIIMIENPEAHLHPRGQAEMGKLIAETVARGVQVFVETHSDHLINGIRVAVKKGVVKPEDVNIAFFERGLHDVAQEDGTINHEIYAEVTNIKVDATGSLSEWPKDFMDEWGIQQMKLLRP